MSILDLLGRPDIAPAGPVDDISSLDFLAPIPSCPQILYASGYRGRAHRGLDLPDDGSEIPIYQGDSSHFLGPTAQFVLAAEGLDLDLEAEIAAIVDTVEQGASVSEAAAQIRMAGLLNDFTYRAELARERRLGCGFVRSKPCSAWAPMLLADEALSSHWDSGTVAATIVIKLNEEVLGICETRANLVHSFAEIIASAARYRRIPAGTVFTSGAVSGASHGFSTLAERQRRTGGDGERRFLMAGDLVEIDAQDERGRSIFGPVRNRIVRGVTG